MGLTPNWTLVSPFAPKETDALGMWEYQEANGSGQSAVSTGASQTTRIFYTAWGRWPNFLDDLLGYAHLVPPVTSSASPSGCAVPAPFEAYTLSRTLPDQHPLILPFYAAEATVEGMVIDGEINAIGFINYKVAKITAVYKAPPFDILVDQQITTEMDRYLTRQAGTSVEVLNVGVGVPFFWVGTKDLVPGTNNKLLYNTELHYIWHEVPAPLDKPFVVPTLPIILQTLGKINCVAFDGYPEGTVLFAGYDPILNTPKLSAENSVVPQYTWTINYKFKVKDQGLTSLGLHAGWNFSYDARRGVWDQQTSGPDAGKPTCGITPSPPCLGYGQYQYADLNSLFKIPVT